MHTRTARGLFRQEGLALTAVLGALAIASGCTGPVRLRAASYDIGVRIEPGTHALNGQTTVTLEREPGAQALYGTSTVDFAVNRALRVETITGRGTRVRSHTIHEIDRGPDHDDAGAAGGDDLPLLVLHRLELEGIGRRAELTFRYGGLLVQDVQAGERRGQVHNFLMAAHIGPEGIYLDEGGGWYPMLHEAADPPRGQAAEYRLAVEPVEGMRLVAGAEPDSSASQVEGMLVWRSRYPLTGMALVGGPHAVKTRQVGPVSVSLHYTPPSDPESRAQIERHTDLFLAAAEKYLGLYQPLVGQYPGEHYTIVENFFSSGFAFPGFTLLNKALFQMGPRGLAHGMLDHEMLHSWWGNAVYVDPADGNWCEALTSFCTNYYGYVLDGDAKGARNQRRNFCVAVSRLDPAEDLPLDTFGRAGGAGREVGYSKGAMVFYMLSQLVGEDDFWAACRRMTQNHHGRFVDWRTIQTTFEEQSGQQLDVFFDQWVRGAGTPQLSFGDAAWRDAARVFEVELCQGEPARSLKVPLRITLEDGTTADRVVDLADSRVTVSQPLEQPAVSVVLDPDFQVLRRLRHDEIVPGVRTTRAGGKLLIVKPGPEVSPFYQRVIEDFTGEPGEREVTLRAPDEVSGDELAGQSVLLLGDAVRSAPVRDLLARAKCPLTWDDAGFSLDEARYDGAGHAVLCTLHHPDLPGAGVTVYYGNSELARGRSDLLLHYRDSLVVFETSSRETAERTIYESRPVARRDFESQTVVEVRRR